MTYHAMLEELEKLCADTVTRQEAVGALGRLRALEKKKPTAEQLTRGALTGAIVGPGALLASKLVGGGVGKGLRAAMKAPGAAGKLTGVAKHLWGGGRQLGGAAASGAVFGAGLPTVRRQLDTSAEKEKLKQYLGTSKRGRLRRQATRYLGV